MNLPWKNINWKDFEILTLHYAENVMPGTRFDDHLKQGNRQSGIDLIARSQSVDRPVCIQCKQKSELTPKGIKSLVSNFLKFEYATPKARFILATTADLHIEPTVKVLEEQQRLLKTQRDIDFEWWDTQTMSNHLMQMWPLVERFFNRSVAAEFCTPALQNTLFTAPPLTPALPRGVYPIQQDNDDPIRQLWRPATGQSIDLTKLFIDERLEIRRIGLIAEPYLGKSVYLKQCAFELANAGQQIEPLFIDVKRENIEPIEAMLTRRYSRWDTTPLKNLVIFIDGLDEAHANDVMALVKYIGGFITGYPSVSIVISCRRAFYNHYELRKWLTDFQFCTFSPLRKEDVEKYIKECFSGHASRFNRATSTKKFDSWLQHPFYLNQLIEEWRRSNKLPATKTKAIQLFIDQAYTQSDDRSFDKGTLAERAQDSRLAAQKLAFTLQLMEQNAVDDTLFQKLFSPQERTLLQHNPLVTYEMGYWFFTNAFFQEHLSALQLRRYPFEKIRQLFTNGLPVRKVKTRWIQTLYALLSVLDDHPNLRNQLRQLLEDDSPELIFESEHTIHSPAFRIECLNRLISYCRDNRMWPQLIYPERIGQFLAGTTQALPVLFQHIEDHNFPISIKIVCCRILGNIPDLTDSHKQDMLSLVHTQLDKTQDTQYAAELITILSSQNLGTKKDVDAIMKKSGFHKHHVFRDKMYRWITNLTLQSLYWPYAVDGIPLLVEHDGKVTQSGSERNLETFLLSFTKREEFYQLVTATRSPEWVAFYRYKGTLRQGFVHDLLKKCIDLAQIYPQFILGVGNFLEHHGWHYLQQDPIGLGQMLNDPTHRDILTRYFSLRVFDPSHWPLGFLVNLESLDYLLYEHEESSLPFKALQTPLTAMERQGNEKQIKTYKRIINDISGGILINQHELEVYKQMQQVEVKRLELDMICIQSRQAFKEAVEHVFSIHKNNKIDVHTLYAREPKKHHALKSRFITQFIHHWIMQGDTAHLADCKEFLDDEDLFRYFRATEILQYHLEPVRFQAELLPLLREYFDTELPHCNFPAAAADTSHESLNHKERLIVSIFSQYRFPTPANQLTEFLWMDSNGFVGTPGFPSNPDLVRTQVWDALGADAAPILIDAVLEHLGKGIVAPGVLATHFDLCDKLAITEARPYLLDALTGGKLDPYELHQVVDIYLRLEGEKDELVRIIETISPRGPVFEYLLDILSIDYPAIVQQKALEAIENDSLGAEENIFLAKIAIGAGAIAGLQFLITHVRNRFIDSRFFSGAKFTRIDTGEALALIDPLLYLLANGVYAANPAGSNPRMILEEWLNALAGKSEQDLQLVSEALNKAEQRLKNQYPDAIDLRWYAFHIKEKIRDIPPVPLTIDQIKAHLQSE